MDLFADPSESPSHVSAVSDPTTADSTVTASAVQTVESVPVVLAPASAATRLGPVLLATDGSCLQNPGGATGWAYVRADGGWASGGRPVGTNQIGELLGVVLALTDHPDVELEIQCDSSYAIGCATTWKKGWQRNNYVNSQRKTVSNLEIIRELHRLIDTRTAKLTFSKVKGHDLSNKWPLNTAVDVVCGLAALATQQAGEEVRDSGTIQINWEQKGSRAEVVHRG
jgi:ribonuclease HI